MMLTIIAGIDEREGDAFSVTTKAGRFHSCGLAEWEIPIPPAPAPALVPALVPAPAPAPKLPDPGLSGQTCYKESDFGNKDDIEVDKQAGYAFTFCKDWEGQKMTSSSSALKRNPVAPHFGAAPAWKPYHYTVAWITGCQTLATEQSVHKPLGEQHAVGANCELLMKEDYLHCKFHQQYSSLFD